MIEMLLAENLLDAVPLRTLLYGAAPMSPDTLRRVLTGDVGSVDADGYLTLVGRCHEMVVRGGENVYPLEVENGWRRIRRSRRPASSGSPTRGWVRPWRRSWYQPIHRSTRPRPAAGAARGI